MSRFNECEKNNLQVMPGSSVVARLPRNGVLRFERKGGAMAGTPAMSFDEDGELALFFADGAALYLENCQA